MWLGYPHLVREVPGQLLSFILTGEGGSTINPGERGDDVVPGQPLLLLHCASPLLGPQPPGVKFVPYIILPASLGPNHGVDQVLTG